MADKDTTQQFSHDDIMKALHDIQAKQAASERRLEEIMTVMSNIWSFIKQMTAFASGTFKRIDE